MPNERLGAELLRQGRQLLGLREVRRLPQHAGSPNIHFAGYLQSEDAPAVFIKVSRDRTASEREGQVSSVVAQFGYPELRVLGKGELTNGYFWLAFPWIPYCQVSPPSTAAEFSEAGTALGLLHRSGREVPISGLRRWNLYGALNRSLERLADESPDLGQQVAARVARLGARHKRWQDYERTVPTVLLHGDFGWRNVVRNPRGRLMLIDFEHAALGPPWLDFAKALDVDLRQESSLQHFLDGYAEVVTWHPLVPDIDYRWGMRLWAVAGILYFSNKHGDEQFKSHGLNILRSFDEEWL